jgi:NAD(P)-dependent dehydrogenase (short-subunit alcohol dehydrogenase family)
MRARLPGPNKTFDVIIKKVYCIINIRILLNLIAEVDEVVNAIVFLLSDKASMIHGVTLPVDGGYREQHCGP